MILDDERRNEAKFGAKINETAKKQKGKKMRRKENRF